MICFDCKERKKDYVCFSQENHCEVKQIRQHPKSPFQTLEILNLNIECTAPCSVPAVAADWPCLVPLGTLDCGLTSGRPRKTDDLPKLSFSAFSKQLGTLPSVRQNRADLLVFLWFNLLEKVLEKGFFGQLRPKKYFFSNFIKTSRKKYSLQRKTIGN